MTPEEMILTLRICGEHPKYKDCTCRDCPWIQNCDHDGGGAELSLRAADIIEQLLRENTELRKKSKRLKPDSRSMQKITDLPEESFDGMA